ncbi:MAG: alpha/beta hydrolase [Smithellaceae bacterium]|nr:alpha/beta hydrolase [Smithellaceae bacterium]
MDNVVLVHGAYQGGWCWRDVAGRLREEGMSVFNPTLTGSGERTHLTDARTNLSTLILDVVNCLFYENLEKVLLVGHSYSGFVISGVAEAVPERIAGLVYLDAMVPLDGQSAFDLVPGTMARVSEVERHGESFKIIAPPGPEALGLEDPQDVAWVKPLLTPMPYNCYAEPISLKKDSAARIPKVYLFCDRQSGGDSQRAHEDAFARAVGDKWDRHVISGPHAVMVSDPESLADLILAVGDGVFRAGEAC